MRAINYSCLRENLKAYFDKINDDSETIVVTRKDNRNIVMISEDEYNNMLENSYILENKHNYGILLNAKSELESGGGIYQNLKG